jgi:hypothetical protein
MVRKMDRRPRPNLMIVGQSRDSLVRKFLRIDQGFVRQPVIDGHAQFPFVLKDTLGQSDVGLSSGGE